MNNYERIKAMSIEEMAISYAKVVDVFFNKFYQIPTDMTKNALILKQWLESEVEDE